MEHAEKMYLVPKHELEQLKGTQPPQENIRTEATRLLDAEMRNILQRPGLGEYDKAKLYATVLQKYLTYVKQGDLDRGKLTLFLPEQTPLEAGYPLETPTNPDAVVQEVLDNVHTRYRKNAKVLLSKLSQHKDISSWDDQGGFIYKGMLVKGSNMLDLVRRTLQTHAGATKQPPKGWDIFMKAMAELNVPSSVMGNVVNRDHLERLKASASDQETPTTPPMKRKIVSKSHWLSL